MTKLRPIVLAVALLALATVVHAQIPQNIAYQGYLTEGSKPFNGNIPASFTLWDAQSGGTQAWNQQSQNVQVTNGYYTVMLDFSHDWQNPYSTFNHQYWLEVLINGKTLGRVQLAASPYAMNARIADSAIHIPQAPVGTVVAFGGDVLKLKNYEKQLGWYVCDGRRIARDSFPEYERMVGTTYGLSDNTDSLFLPDFRCLFLRGVDGGMTGARTNGDSLKDLDASGRGMMRDGGNQGNKVGSVQKYALQSHVHLTPIQQGLVTPGSMGIDQVTNATTGVFNHNDVPFYTSAPIDPLSGQYFKTSETRPSNAYVYWLIKVK
jgi:hypothetical protein